VSANHNDETSGVNRNDSKSLDDLINRVDFGDYKGTKRKIAKKLAIHTKNPDSHAGAWKRDLYGFSV